MLAIASRINECCRTLGRSPRSSASFTSPHDSNTSARAERYVASAFAYCSWNDSLDACVPDRPMPDLTLFADSSSRRRPIPHAQPELSLTVSYTHLTLPT